MPTIKTGIRFSKKQPLSEQELRQLHAYWRAANYLTACQLYLMDNPLLERPLVKSDLKQTIVGHWGTCPGQNFIYTHLDRVIKRDVYKRQEHRRPVLHPVVQRGHRRGQRVRGGVCHHALCHPEDPQ